VRIRDFAVGRVDLIVAAVATVATVAPVVVPRVQPWWLVGLALLASAPVAWRRRWLWPVFVVVGAATTGMVLLLSQSDTWLLMPYGALICTYTLADISSPILRMVGVVVVGVGVVATLVIPHEDFFTYRYVATVYVAAYALGTGARARRAQRTAERERARRIEESRATAVERERTRIARDMHDIVTHSVGLMIVQAEAGPLVTRTAPEKADAAFDSIADTGRSAVSQLRQILGTLRGSTPDPAAGREPQPGLGAVYTLLERARQSGLAVHLAEHGDHRQVAADVDVSAYRIIQESLTNTMKHAGATRVDIFLTWSSSELTVEVRDDGHGVPELHPGHGVVGMRERAETCGGTLAIDPRGFTVSARLPIG
jgi:signal transduction histidine kinase